MKPEKVRKRVEFHQAWSLYNLQVNTLKCVGRSLALAVSRGCRESSDRLAYKPPASLSEVTSLKQLLDITTRGTLTRSNMSLTFPHFGCTQLCARVKFSTRSAPVWVPVSSTRVSMWSCPGTTRVPPQPLWHHSPPLQP